VPEPGRAVSRAAARRGAFRKTGSIPDLYRHYGIDANAIIAAAATLTPGRPMRHLKALP
jgi:pyruvate dehydrogenase E1 component